MFYLACTRFNTETYSENINYRHNNNEIVIYGSNVRIRDIYPIGAKIIVAEMNNETNEIEGLGFILNIVVNDKRHKIYRNDYDEYNRYIYRGKHWISKEEINEYNPKILEMLKQILFKGKSNFKRRMGITIITEKPFNRWDYDYVEFKILIKNMFIKFNKIKKQKTISNI
jgi:hypothetical protein